LNENVGGKLQVERAAPVQVFKIDFFMLPRHRRPAEE